MGVVLDDGAHRVGPLCNGLDRYSSQFVFQVTPEPLPRIACGAIGRQQHRPDIGRPAPRFGLVAGTVVEPQHIARLGDGGGAALSPPWEGAAVEGGQCEKAVRSGGRFDRPIQGEGVALGRDGRHRLAPAGGNPTPDDRQSPQPRCILGQDSERLSGGGPCELRGEDSRQGGLQRGHGLWVFWRARAVAVAVSRGVCTAPAHARSRTLTRPDAPWLTRREAGRTRSSPGERAAFLRGPSMPW